MGGGGHNELTEQAKDQHCCVAPDLHFTPQEEGGLTPPPLDPGTADPGVVTQESFTRALDTWVMASRRSASHWFLSFSTQPSSLRKLLAWPATWAKGWSPFFITPTPERIVYDCSVRQFAFSDVPLVIPP